MKKITIFTAFLMLSLFSKSQLFFGIGAGASTKKAFIWEMNVGGIINEKTVIQGGYQAHLDAINPAIFQIKAGKRFYFNNQECDRSGAGIQITAGYSYHLKSTDNKSENKHTGIATAEVFLPFGYGGEWTASATYTPGYFIATFSVRGFIKRY